MSLHIRWMIRRDLEEVHQIDESAHEWDAWSENQMLMQLRQRNCIGMVVELDLKVVGFMIYELHNDHLKLIKIEGQCKPEMIQKMKSKLANHRRTKIICEVDGSNLQMQVTLRENGFQTVSIVGDTYIMEYLLDSFQVA